ncbi:MAG: extracellular solute-binding protein [bacterium]|nr:extracellular solute-binding protein [bacterium]
MEENVVFGNSKNTTEQPVAVQPAPQASSVPVSPPPPPETPSPPPSLPTHHGILGLLLKILIPLLVLGVLVVVFITYVLPIIRNSGIVGNGAPVAITYWGLWEPKEVIQPIIDEFETQNKGIKVTYEQRDIKRYKETLLTRINGGDGPDVYRFHNSWTKSMKDVLSPIPSSVITTEEFKKYYPVVQSDMVVSGGVYGIPLMMDTLVMFVNDKILEDYGIGVPETWEDFTKVAGAVTVPDETGQIHTYGAAIGSYDTISRAPDILSVLFAQNRINLKEPGKASPGSVEEALRFYTNFATGRDNFVKVWNPEGQPALEAFAGGNVAMYFGYSWDIFTVKARSPELVFSTHKIPYLSTPITVASYWAEGVSSKSKHQKESLLFLQFLTKKETQQKLYTLEAKTRLFGELPAREDLAAAFSDNALLFPFLDQAKFAVSSYFVSDTHDSSVNEQLNTYLGNAVRSVLGNTSPGSAVETLLKGVNQVLTRYGIN